MKDVHNDDEVLNHYLGLCLKLVDVFLGDIRDREYPTRKENLIKFLENPDLETEGPDNVNLRDLQNFLQLMGKQNFVQRERVLASLKQHLQPQLPPYFSNFSAALIEKEILQFPLKIRINLS